VGDSGEDLRTCRVSGMNMTTFMDCLVAREIPARFWALQIPRK
jgi:hypothetical protein